MPPVNRFGRVCVVAACLILSGLAPPLALMGLSPTISKFGALALLVLLSWILAIAALGVLFVSWIIDWRIGKASALACCALGFLALFALPVFWPADFPGSVFFELLLTLPSVLLASYVTRFHCTPGVKARGERRGLGLQSALSALSLRLLLVLCLIASIPLWIWNTKLPLVQEYRLYFSEHRVDAALQWEQLSHEWTEARVRDHFKSARVRCLQDESGVPEIQRVCAVDLHALNGVQTMTVNFLFSAAGLQRVATNIPWWAHADGLQHLVRDFGPPDASQEQAISGVRLYGWKLPSGAALFYNRDRDLSPLMTSSIQWAGPGACGNDPRLR